MLPKQISSHCDSLGDLTRDSDQISYGPPNDHVQINWLLKSIQTGDQTVITNKYPYYK